jgi:hypothetical protein
MGEVPKDKLLSLQAYAQLIRNFDSGHPTLFSVSQKGEPESIIPKQESDLLSNQPIEGGPKTSEVSEETMSKEGLGEGIDISKGLSETQRADMMKVLTRNVRAFAFDGRLGNYDEKVEIPMKEFTKPISIPPYPLSPANRETVDAQMDAWLKLEVIEPSRSPWAAPVFIVHRNGKPRMVIDLRRLNEQVVADELPLPRQEDIVRRKTLPDLGESLISAV